MKKTIIEWIVSILTAVLLVFCIKFFLFDTYKVDGSSMEETFQHGDRVVVNKIQQHFKDYKLGDIIVFNVNENTLNIKRIIGTPGDSIEVKDKVIYINGEPLEEDYVEHQFRSPVRTSLVRDLDGEPIPEDQFLVLGDNRPNSRDSRSYGLVDKEQIIGEVQLRIWPLDSITNQFK